MDKTIKRDSENRALVKRTSRITGLSVRQVERVISGDSKNEQVLSVYMELLETGIEQENKLKAAVMKLVPIPSAKPKNEKAI